MLAALAIRVAVNSAALWVAASLVSGIELSSDLWSVLVVAAVLGVVNAILRPLVMLLSLPAILLTLGAFILVVNAAMLALTAALTDSLAVDGFWSNVFGAIILSVVSWALSTFTDDSRSNKRTDVR